MTKTTAGLRTAPASRALTMRRLTEAALGEAERILQKPGANAGMYGIAIDFLNTVLRDQRLADLHERASAIKNASGGGGERLAAPQALAELGALRRRQGSMTSN